METNTPEPEPPTIKPPSSPNPLKRKDPPGDREDPSPPPPTNSLPEGATLADGEYSSGHVVCDFCGTKVPFRDEQTDAFTTKIWDDHRIACGAQAPPAGDAIIYTPESTAEALAHPAPKRRRAKRSEDERIEYLRSDPYVAQFEAYRVLCASCDKWIRLRPNSTYCSIPWDAHRKSCLAKKINSKNIYALEERNTLLSKDPDVRKFDAERVLCNMCDRWVSVNPDDHLQAVQKWLEHRASCQKATSVQQAPVRDPAPAPHAADHPKAGPSSAQSSTPTSITSPVSPEIASISTQPTLRLSQPQSPSSFHDLNPTNYAPAHESRRRNAEQRAATLRADNLIGEVEPNRVFCSLCQKWVQLRQDSSYCAYPWLQHRGKCLARHQRRAQKAAEIARLKARKLQHPGRGSGQDELISDGDMDPDDDVESEDGADSPLEDDCRRMDPRRAEHEKGGAVRPRYKMMARASVPYHQHAASRKSHGFYHGDSRGQPSTSHLHSHLHPHPHAHPHPHPNTAHSSSRASRPWKVEEVDGDADAEGDSYVEEDPHPHHSVSRAPLRRPKPTGLADLDSPSGRKHFIFSSVHHLFATTYEASDDLSISALLTYLNAAVPLDKHEDFDTSEVIKAVAALQEKGRIRFEGDMLRLVE